MVATIYGRLQGYPGGGGVDCLYSRTFQSSFSCFDTRQSMSVSNRHAYFIHKFKEFSLCQSFRQRDGNWVMGMLYRGAT